MLERVSPIDKLFPQSFVANRRNSSNTSISIILQITESKNRSKGKDSNNSKSAGQGLPMIASLENEYFRLVVGVPCKYGGMPFRITF